MIVYQTIAVVFITFAVSLLILGGKSINCSPLSGFIACTVLTFCVTSSLVYGNAVKLSVFEAILCLGVGLMLCNQFLPDFFFFWSDFRFNYGFLLLMYFVYGWTFSHVYLLWFWIAAITLVFGVLSLLFGGLFSGLSYSSRSPRIHYPDSDEWMFDDD